MNTKSIILFSLAAALLPLSSQAKPDGKSPPEDKGDRPSVGELFKRLDADESGTLSKEEAKGPIAKNFDRIDENEDGEISKKELAKLHKQMAERQKERGGERGEKFKEMDSDASGTISKDEAGARLLEHFDEIDTDDDGELSKEELKAAFEKRKGAPKKGPRPTEEDSEED